MFLLEEAAFVFRNKLGEGIIICIIHTLWTLVSREKQEHKAIYWHFFAF